MDRRGREGRTIDRGRETKGKAVMKIERKIERESEREREEREGEERERVEQIST